MNYAGERTTGRLGTRQDIPERFDGNVLGLVAEPRREPSQQRRTPVIHGGCRPIRLRFHLACTLVPGILTHARGTPLRVAPADRVAAKLTQWLQHSSGFPRLIERTTEATGRAGGCPWFLFVFPRVRNPLPASRRAL